MFSEKGIECERIVIAAPSHGENGTRGERNFSNMGS